VFIGEHLTRVASKLFFEARKMMQEKRVLGCWTASGNIFVKRTEMEKPILVRDLTSLTNAARC